MKKIKLQRDHIKKRVTDGFRRKSRKFVKILVLLWSVAEEVVVGK